MFIKELDNKEKIWEFQLISNNSLTGKVNDYVVDGQGHPIMVQVEGLIGIWDIPWTSIVGIREVYVTGETQKDG